MNHNGIFSLSFPETKTIIVSGDIHELLSVGVQTMYPILDARHYGVLSNILIIPFRV